MKPEVGTKWKS